MRSTRGRLVTVDSLPVFDQRIAAGAHDLNGWRIRGVDLSARSEVLARCRLGGATFLGCRFAAGDAARVEAAGGLVLSTIPGVPVDTFRAKLYTPEELYDAEHYHDTLDARAYAWSEQPDGTESLLAKLLHDQAIDEALTAWRARHRLVGVMGGHRDERGAPAYVAAARLGHALGDGLLVTTGGGPGVMEAANLGARMAHRPVAELHDAIGMLAAQPAYRPSVRAWARAGFEVCERFGDANDSLGIPTWHYGHEPPNVFATRIAKYFRNSTREAILLEVCDAGIAFLPGLGGTVQEIFQDACENFYADESAVAPMVLVGRDYWTHTLPAWPLLAALASDRVMADRVHLVDSVEEAAEVLRG